MSLQVLQDLLGRGEAKDDEERHDGDIASSRGDPGDLLEQADAEKENVGVTSELFIQELGDESDETVLRGGDLIGFEFLSLQEEKTVTYWVVDLLGNFTWLELI